MSGARRTFVACGVAVLPFAKGKRISLDPEGNVVPAAKDTK